MMMSRMHTCVTDVYAPMSPKCKPKTFEPNNSVLQKIREALGNNCSKCSFNTTCWCLMGCTPSHM